MNAALVANRARARALRRISETINWGLLAALRTMHDAAVPTPGLMAVSGFLNETLGVGRAARLTVQGLRAAGLHVAAHDLRDLWPHRAFQGAPAPLGPGGVWLLHCNAPEAVAALAKARRTDWRGAYRIGYWAYESALAPRLWREATHLFHEIWVPSTFVADALSHSGAPVRTVAHPVSPPAKQPRRPPEYAQQIRHVLALGDLNSSMTRKNILGAIAMFRQAHPTPRANQIRLVVKVVSRPGGAAAMQRLRAAMADRDDIILVTRDMDDADALGFLAHADVLLHPHRAEGYGLAIAEALAMGVPALATGWSGNMDFMSDAPALLIPFRLTPVYDPDGVYPGRPVWADPDIDAGATLLRALLDQPRLAADAVTRAQAQLRALQTVWTPESLAALPFAAYCGDSFGTISPSRPAP